MASRFQNPTPVQQGAAISEWQSYTPTFSNITMVGVSGFWRRVGDSMEVMLDGNYSSGTTAAAITASLPSGYNIDTSKLVSAVGNLNTVVGNGVWYDDNTGTERSLAVTTDTATTVKFRATDNSTVRDLYGNEFATSDQLGARFTVPIAEWAGSGTANLGPGAQVEYAYNDVTTDADTTSSGFAYGPGGGLVPNISGATNRTKVVQFQYPIQADDILTVEINIDPSNSNAWFDAQQFLGTVNTTTGVMAVRRSGSQTQCDVTWGYSGHGSTLFASANTWATRYSNGWKWRVRKAKASSPVGFGKASTANGFGLVAPRKGQYNLSLVSGSPAATTIRAVGIYYQDQDGNHRLKFNATWDVSLGIRTLATVAITGITTKNVTNHIQTFTGLTSVGALLSVGYILPNTNVLTIEHASGNVSRYYVSGDIELESAPTWA